MESELTAVADYAIQQPGVTGYICVDNKGLCLTAKGQAHESMSGIIHQLSDLASKIECPPDQRDNVNASENPPVIRVDMERHKILIQSTDSITVALMSPQK